jgi:phage gp46-like protein
MATESPKPVHELAGQQEDELIEDVLASLFTDLPVREVESPGDTRQKSAWQMGYVGGSRLWLSFSKPLTDDTPKLVEQRAETSLAWLIPVIAKSVVCKAKQITFDSIQLDVKILRLNNKTIDLSFVLPGGSSA